MRRQRALREVLVGVLEARVIESHPDGELPEDFGVRFRFAQRRDRRIVDHPVQMPVRGVDVEVFELRRRRQQDVRVVGRIGLEVFDDHGEQILARESGNHFSDSGATATGFEL